MLEETLGGYPGWNTDGKLLKLGETLEDRAVNDSLQKADYKLHFRATRNAQPLELSANLSCMAAFFLQLFRVNTWL